MSRSLLERRLFELSGRLKEMRVELGVIDEQLAALNSDADEARLRAVVSETPLADRDHRNAQRHADAMARRRGEVAASITKLESTSDELLDRLMAELP